ncbi:MAG: DUF58 domain-containing protein [Sulfurimonas sp.]|nr:DUF58 domain-containing protein [Sulfurimonas sp.]
MYEYLKSSPLASLLIKAQKSVFSSTVGENSTFLKGSGFDFVELREYSTGDDIKHIDWIISAKKNRPHVKVFHQEKELNISITPLLSASLNFGTHKLKLDTLQETVALLAFSSVKQENAYQSYIYTKEIQIGTKLSKNIFSVRELLEKIHKVPLFGESINYKALPSKFNRVLKQHSLLFFIGDFLNTQDLEIGFLADKHEIIIIIIRDRFEENPTALGEINITDPQSGLSARVNIDKKAALKLKMKLLKDDDILFSKLNKSGVKYLKIYTDEEPLEKLLPFMSSI